MREGLSWDRRFAREGDAQRRPPSRDRCVPTHPPGASAARRRGDARGARRRTPGLRREEVAVLAGVSPEWYTWLEQARDVRPSAATLHRIGEALRLEPAELQHLLALCGYGGDQPGNGAVHSPTVGRHVQLLLDEFDPCPAWVYGARWDILAWNRAATIVHGDLGAMEGMERNGLHQMFLNPRFRQW